MQNLYNMRSWDNFLRFGPGHDACVLPFLQVEGTVWSRLEGVDATVDYEALEEDFAAKEAAKVCGLV